MLHDPIGLAETMRQAAVRGDRRKYYRVARGRRWYGGIATADCLGCNLRCIFRCGLAPHVCFTPNGVPREFI